MKTEVLKRFTPQILLGLEDLGVKISDLKKLLKVTQTDIDEMRHGLTDLTAAQGKRIQARTGRSVGEIALIGVARQASPRARRENAELIESTLQMLGELREVEFGSKSISENSSRAPKRPISIKRKNGSSKSRAA